MRTAVLILAILAIAAVAAKPMSKKDKAVKTLEARRLGFLSGNAKTMIKGVAKYIIAGLLDCFFEWAKGQIMGWPIFKGTPIDKLLDRGTGPLKKFLNDAITGAINKLVDSMRRRAVRRRMWGFNPFDAVKNAANAVGNAAKGAVNAVSNAAKAVGGTLAGAAKFIGSKVGDAVNAVSHLAGEAANVAKMLNKLTGGKLGAMLAKVGCPLFVKGVYTAMNIGLKAATGVPTLVLPACLNGAITSACQDGVKKIFGRLRALRRMGIVKKSPVFYM